MRKVFLAALFLFSFAPSAQARTIFIEPKEGVQAAIEKAAADDTLVVRGIHVENLVIIRNLTIQGEKNERDGIFPFDTHDVIQVRSGNVTISRLKITGMGIKRQVGIRVTTNASIDNCLITNCEAGIVYSKNATGKAFENDSNRNRCFGIHVGSKASPTITRNRFDKNFLSGISYSMGGGGEASDNLCTDSEIYGIYVAKNANPLLTRNVCSGNKETGIRYANNAGGEASHNRCNGNEYGIRVGSGATPSLSFNSCEDNLNTGIHLEENATPRLRENACQNNGNSSRKR
ncbi:MAG TPA: right-handed parallel beta-helix repeat-containing protein [Chroococcales cyanobacterium]